MFCFIFILTLSNNVPDLSYTRNAGNDNIDTGLALFYNI